MAESDERLARYLKQLNDADKDGDGGFADGHVDRLQEKIAAIRDRRAQLEENSKALA